MPLDTNATTPEVYPTQTQDTNKAGEVISVAEVSGRPADLQEHLANVSNATQEVSIATKEQLQADKKVQGVFLKLEEKFGESFDRKNFDIKSCGLEEREIALLGHDVFTLWDKSKNKLLAYINQDGETLYEMKNFKGFESRFGKAFWKQGGLEFKQKENGEWIMIIDNEIYPEGSSQFDTHIITEKIFKY
ncbi:MAG: hypothetical protein N4A38_03775 [Candidatus Gracilibacteria bacterium]|nr:hypothetical protein [Candidatus Gracilibacteria bacterium]